MYHMDSDTDSWRVLVSATKKMFAQPMLFGEIG